MVGIPVSLRVEVGTTGGVLSTTSVVGVYCAVSESVAVGIREVTPVVGKIGTAGVENWGMVEAAADPLGAEASGALAVFVLPSEKEWLPALSEGDTPVSDAALLPLGSWPDGVTWGSLAVAPVDPGTAVPLKSVVVLVFGLGITVGTVVAGIVVGDPAAFVVVTGGTEISVVMLGERLFDWPERLGDGLFDSPGTLSEGWLGEGVESTVVRPSGPETVVTGTGV